MSENRVFSPVGDKVILREAEADEEVRIIGREVYARVIAAGPGMPYGRGEFYSPAVKEGDLVILSRKVWESPDTETFAHEGSMLRVVHERQILTRVIDG